MIFRLIVSKTIDIRISYLIIFLFPFVFIGCSTVKTSEKYGAEIDVVDNVRSRVLIEKFNTYDKNKSFLIFTSEFKNVITVKNGDSLVINKNAETTSMLGFTTACIIFNNKDVIIIIDNKKEIKLNEVQLPKYKFIYVGKDKNHYIIEYTNHAKSFL
ncbi:hypothetical protein JOE44_000120 [Chryseobacterium sp. PvR013]|uniref:hypothetical protein n=1 Tax=Chryseobacterium sp. PvR013 TaxID=2806595 RepID=UPI001AE1EBF9|nr:hypothetical protein [Chryseobacterium sp. PvR013]MBP1163236.1 hypothetical protein [Chryseobacterium sp. PvR013]